MSFKKEAAIRCRMAALDNERKSGVRMEDIIPGNTLH
jgi:hypothetical protein